MSVLPSTLNFIRLYDRLTLLYMAKMNIHRSILIDAPAVEIFQKLNDFNEWRPWSPWLIMEPEVKVEVAKDTKSYSWEGNRVGSGNMKVLKEETNTFIEYDLNFIKPWKSTAKTSFKLEEKEKSTEVIWNMDSQLPFYMFWMKGMMEAFVGADYERGLDMLKEYVENGEVPSKLEFKGTKNFDGCKYIGIKTTTSLNSVGDSMASDFNKIRQYIEPKQEIAKGNAFSIYHKWDIKNNKVSYTSSVPVATKPDDLPAEFIYGEIPSISTQCVKHIGPYEHLGNAWSTMYAMHRNKEFKINKNVDPFEIYMNNPMEVDRKDLITEVNFPVK